MGGQDVVYANPADQLEQQTSIIVKATDAVGVKLECL